MLGMFVGIVLSVIPTVFDREFIADWKWHRKNAKMWKNHFKQSSKSGAQ